MVWGEASFAWCALEHGLGRWLRYPHATQPSPLPVCTSCRASVENTWQLNSLFTSHPFPNACYGLVPLISAEHDPLMHHAHFTTHSQPPQESCSNFGFLYNMPQKSPPQPAPGQSGGFTSILKLKSVLKTAYSCA